ncbi:hypothetical protein [Clostridium sp. ZS2-4]|uniref:hypothetical protein n=1 Tax=Clostridium sp. ZS2-4 TaxID=2987703 RepID=UPI00227D0794|nr:hypothetical protein [Clostridium sp. ZS2-4]MCY6356043.1 hypothetical protein [Clostridium sp. ZS2-4]
MKWVKKGLVFNPKNKILWAKNSALTPTPILISKNIIRVYAGFRDEFGVSRIGYVDLNADNPSEIINISKKPVLDIGKLGAFDDNGMILGDVVYNRNKIYMYYVGFQLVQKVKFLAYTGLAISENNGETFYRYSEAPILDRCDDELYIRSIHSVIYDNGIWKAWGGIGNGWQIIDGKPYPKYNIRYYESVDGIIFKGKGKVCIDTKGEEYRIGRPRVIKEGNRYRMFYTYGTLNKDYISGYAESNDGINWIRKDNEIGIGLSSSGWDCKHFAYPAILKYNERTYMFYNGNDFGKDGFGYAELVK